VHLAAQQPGQHTRVVGQQLPGLGRRHGQADELDRVVGHQLVRVHGRTGPQQAAGAGQPVQEAGVRDDRGLLAQGAGRLPGRPAAVDDHRRRFDLEPGLRSVSHGFTFGPVPVVPR
jgi:hypothetical protein